MTSTTETFGADAGRWDGWLREVVLRVPDASDAAGYYAQLLGGTAAGEAVELGSGTRLRMAEGPPGVEAATLEMVAPQGRLRTMTDPDGRRLAIETVEDCRRPLTDAVARLGHVTVESDAPDAAVDFYLGLGFQVSEALAGRFRWLRCNPIHHTIAVARGPVSGVHHVGIEVPDRTALIAACDRLAELGHRVEYGPGRHMVGNNLFIYFRDRHGIRIEVFCELERVLDADRPPVVHETVERERSINLWGPQPPESYWQALADARG